MRDVSTYHAKNFHSVFLLNFVVNHFYVVRKQQAKIVIRPKAAVAPQFTALSCEKKHEFNANNVVVAHHFLALCAKCQLYIHVSIHSSQLDYEQTKEL